MSLNRPTLQDLAEAATLQDLAEAAAFQGRAHPSHSDDSPTGTTQPTLQIPWPIDMHGRPPTVFASSSYPPSHDVASLSCQVSQLQDVWMSSQRDFGYSSIHHPGLHFRSPLTHPACPY